MQSRIYTYKITFEEVPYWYWGVHKEKRYNDGYMGSPVTHRWMWDFYTPKIQILEFFPLSEEGWKSALEVEKRLITPDLDNPYCLNEAVGNIISLKSLVKAGIVSGTRNVELKRGICNPEYLASPTKHEDCVRNGRETFRKRVGCHSPEFLASEKRKLSSQSVGQDNVRLGRGFCSMESRAKVVEVLSLPIRCIAPDGTATDFASAREIERSLGFPQATVSQAAKRGTVVNKGKAKGFLFEIIFTEENKSYNNSSRGTTM